MFTTLKARLSNALTGGSFAHRLGRGLSAQAYCKGVTIFTQLVSVPILLSAWGTELFGLWLLLATVPTYLNLMDAGFTKVAGNDMIMRVAQDDWTEARRSLHSMTALSLAVFGTGCLIASAVVSILWNTDALKFEAAADHEVALTLYALIVSVFLGRLQGLAGSIAGATKRVAQGFFWSGTIQLLETLSIVSVALLGAGIAEAAFAGAVARLTGSLAMIAAVAMQVPSLRIGLGQASLGKVRSLLKPAMGALFLSLNNALIMQGPLLILGAVLGTSAVAVFSVTRTFTRFGFQIVNSLNTVLSPEYSRLYKTSISKYKLLYKRNMQTAIFISISYFIGIALIGRHLLDLYTLGKIQPGYTVLLVLALCVGVEMIWRVTLQSLFSINRHARLSFYMSLITSCSIALGYILCTVWGLSGLVSALLLYNIAILAACTWEERQVISGHPVETDGQALT